MKKIQIIGMVLLTLPGLSYGSSTCSALINATAPVAKQAVQATCGNYCLCAVITGAAAYCVTDQCCIKPQKFNYLSAVLIQGKNH